MIPSAAWEEPKPVKVGLAIPSEGSAFVLNAYHDVQYLTVEQALDQIATLSGILLADRYARGHGGAAEDGDNG